ncbi:serine/threonine-protein kinase [Nocardia sp. CDC160]|uniref:serine/threonine-protein kinase n=1 Tax=Nocardia sp. CDC160 TaxID=3112166 RepID=UPI002DB73818|nr:serine/threonine-protein kinase [Nocardia sp. CDC160]MEC3913072.1 serine/threonine-protein kinase [Nocardia sp. CDC160]
MTRGIPLGDGYLGRYRLDELLGSGGSAEVWRAHDTVADRTVTLKLLAPVLTADPEYRRRFEREARAAAVLHGPHVMAVHTYGELEGRLFIDSEFVDGLDIEALLEWEGPMAPDAAVDLIAQVATALDEAHAAGLVHRDVKPQNIIVAPDDVAYLIDFGTALEDGQTAITQIGMLVGTPAYMAPERFDGASTPRSDIYSLACVLYECLTGQRPFRLRNPAQLMRAHLERIPEPPSSLAPRVPAALDAVVARGLAKDPTQRFATAGEFAAAARAALDVPEAPATATIVPVTGEPRGETPTLALSIDTKPDGADRRWARRRVWALAGSLVTAFAIVMGAAWYTGRADAPDADPHTPVPTTTTVESPVRESIPTTTEESPPPSPTPEPEPAPEPPETELPETEGPIPTAPVWTLPPPPIQLPNLIPGGGLPAIPNGDHHRHPHKPH